jgi:uncharacterized membrane protein required for colicin V production
MGTFFDILIVLILIYELVLGFLDGFGARFLRLLGLVLALTLATRFAVSLSGALGAMLAISSIKMVLISWLCIFGAMATPAFFLVRWAEHTQDQRIGDGVLSITSHIFGSICGGIHGVLLALVLTWSYGLVRVNFLPRAASFQTARLMPVIERANEAIAFVAVYQHLDSEPIARRIAWQLGHPARTSEYWHKLIDQTSFKYLLQSDLFWEIVRNGDQAEVLDSSLFQDLVHDKIAMTAMRPLILPIKNYENPLSRQYLAEQLALLGRNFEQMKDDAFVVELIESIKKDGLLEHEARVLLMKDRRFLRLLNRIMSEGSVASE